MDHVAIDLGGVESQICMRRGDATIVEERRHGTASLKKYLATLAKSRVVMETSAEAFAVADAALEVGHEVRVVPSGLVRSLGVGARGVKNDRRDAQVLSEVSCRIDLPSVHIPSQRARQRKSVIGMRDGLVAARTQLINTVRGWMRTTTTRIRSGAAETFPRRVRDYFRRHEQELPRAVERQLKAIDALSEQIAEADAELSDEANRDETCQRLMTVPGVGAVTALCFVAVVDEISRFGNAHALESYIGLVPGEDSSSTRERRTGITKAGAKRLRTALVQAAWVLRRSRPKDPMALWNIELEHRRGKRIAVVALARKLAGVLHALWRNGTIYDPLHR